MFIGVDGGGTRTTLALADGTGVEILRRVGPPGLVESDRPEAAAAVIVLQVQDLLREAGKRAPVDALCAGLAGTGDPAARAAVRSALEKAGFARRVVVCSDGDIALQGALNGSPGLLLMAGTGSIAWGRGENGRVERCGGWGQILGDEGSAYAMGRAAVMAALRAYDGRGPETSLRDGVLAEVGAPDPEALPAWARRAEKAEIADLARLVVRSAEGGDQVAADLVGATAAGLADHATALIRRLSPWRSAIRVVLHGGLAREPYYEAEVRRCLIRIDQAMNIVAPVADSVTGALHIARASALSGPGEDRQ